MAQIEIDPIFIEINYPSEQAGAENQEDQDEQDEQGEQGDQGDQGSQGGRQEAEEKEPEEFKCPDRLDPPLVFFWHGLFLKRVVYIMWLFGWLNCCMLCSTSARVLFKRDDQDDKNLSRKE